MADCVMADCVTAVCVMADGAPPGQSTAGQWRAIGASGWFRSSYPDPLPYQRRRPRDPSVSGGLRSRAPGPLRVPRCASACASSCACSCASEPPPTPRCCGSLSLEHHILGRTHDCNYRGVVSSTAVAERFRERVRPCRDHAERGSSGRHRPVAPRYSVVARAASPAATSISRSEAIASRHAGWGTPSDPPHP